MADLRCDDACGCTTPCPGDTTCRFGKCAGAGEVEKRKAVDQSTQRVHAESTVGAIHALVLRQSPLDLPANVPELVPVLPAAPDHSLLFVFIYLSITFSLFSSSN
ncbi:Metallothionein-like protein 4B [Senna tora]|uniref:Metallothionein-like protein 4B n=1 Tax=Senna tora TaxID=362788 RepID=A0A834WM09_9FABA|nr:Metallothionein-like protein 4B [Senna tora]